MTLNYQMMLERYPLLRKRLAVQFPAVKSPLYMTDKLPGGSLPHVLWPWHVGPLSPKKKEKKRLEFKVHTNCKQFRLPL
jgi:hypothetical protein